MCVYFFEYSVYLSLFNNRKAMVVFGGHAKARAVSEEIVVYTMEYIQGTYFVCKWKWQRVIYVKGVNKNIRLRKRTTDVRMFGCYSVWGLSDTSLRSARPQGRGVGW